MDALCASGGKWSVEEEQGQKEDTSRSRADIVLDRSQLLKIIVVRFEAPVGINLPVYLRIRHPRNDLPIRVDGVVRIWVKRRVNDLHLDRVIVRGQQPSPIRQPHDKMRIPQVVVSHTRERLRREIVLVSVGITLVDLLHVAEAEREMGAVLREPVVLRGVYDNLIADVRLVHDRRRNELYRESRTLAVVLEGSIHGCDDCTRNVVSLVLAD